MAKEFFGGRDPLGKHIKDLFPGSNAQFEIVGVAQDVPIITCGATSRDGSTSRPHKGCPTCRSS